MKIKKLVIPAILTILLINIGASSANAEIIEKIYAVVNDEIITYSQFKNAEAEMTRVLSQQYEGEELETKIEEMKKTLLDRLIEQKLIQSYANEKNYDVDGEVELIINDIKKQNNISSDEELKKAIASQGINYDDWKKQLKESRIQQKFIYDEVGSKINIDSAAIMEYYRNNIDQYTTPIKLTLNCIFLNKDNYIYPKALQDKKETISSQLANTSFKEVAEQYSELPGDENNYTLGEFEKGELDPKIEEAALKLKKGEHSGWVETNTGWYIVQLENRTKPQLVEYKLVREKIEQKLMSEEQEKRLEKYVEKIKKDSYIKIYE